MKTRLPQFDSDHARSFIEGTPHRLFRNAITTSLRKDGRYAAKFKILKLTPMGVTPSPAGIRTKEIALIIRSIFPIFCPYNRSREAPNVT